MSDDITDAIEENAVSPASVTSDGVTVTMPRLADQIAADKYVKSATARTSPVGALRRVQIVPPGA